MSDRWDMLYAQALAERDEARAELERLRRTVWDYFDPLQFPVVRDVLGDWEPDFTPEP